MHWTQTEEGRERMRRSMKARWKSGAFKGTTGGYKFKKRKGANGKAANAERFDVGDKVIMVTPKEGEYVGKYPDARTETKVNKTYGRTLYSLAKYVRAEIHKHVRAGNELEPVHTHTLALTDAIMRNGVDEE